jgi:hypothetical protein
MTDELRTFEWKPVKEIYILFLGKTDENHDNFLSKSLVVRLGIVRDVYLELH